MTDAPIVSCLRPTKPDVHVFDAPLTFVASLRAVRSIVYRFIDLARLERLLFDAEEDLLLELPDDDDVEDGEWVLAIFEVGSGRRATAAAARGTMLGDTPRLAFEPRDYQRICEFVAAARKGSSIPAEGPCSAPYSVPIEFDAPAPPTPRSAGEDTLRSAMSPAPPPSVSVVAPPSVMAGARVLLVDDDPDILEVVSAMLEVVGLVTTTAHSAEEALTLATTYHFDLLVVDWNLPAMNGLDLCRTVRHTEQTATIPVLFLSANDSEHDMVEAFASGADDYVLKPFRAPELGARIFGLLRRARMTNSGRYKAATLRTMSSKVIAKKKSHDTSNTASSSQTSRVRTRTQKKKSERSTAKQKISSSSSPSDKSNDAVNSQTKTQSASRVESNVVVTRQGGKAEGVTSHKVQRLAEAMLKRLDLVGAELSIMLTNDSNIQSLNAQYRGKNKPTDVLAFAMNEGEVMCETNLLGDVVISLDTAARQAFSRKRPPLAEVTMLLAHGLLHLLGYDHAEPDEARDMRNATRILVRAATANASRSTSATKSGRRSPPKTL